MKKQFISLFIAFTVCTPIQAELYKWVDEDGNTHYGDHIPPQYAPKGHKTLSEHGNTLEVVPRAKTKDELAKEAAEREAKAEAERIAAEKQAKLDAIKAAKEADDNRIINSYMSASSIEKMRNEKVELIEASVRLAVSRSEKLTEELTKLQLDAARQERSGKPVSAASLERLAAVQKQLDENKEFIQSRRIEQQEIKANFDQELKRFLELTQPKEP